MTSRRVQLVYDDVEACHGPVCVTCSDQAATATVLEMLQDEMARVRTSVGDEIVSVALVEARAGDTILVHAGEALTVVPAR